MSQELTMYSTTNNVSDQQNKASKFSYCETIDPDDNQSQAQDCIDYDPYPGGDVDENGDLIQKSENRLENQIQLKKEITNEDASMTPIDSITTNNAVAPSPSVQPSQPDNFSMENVSPTTDTTATDCQKRIRLNIQPLESTTSEIKHQKEVVDAWHVVGIYNELNAKVTGFIPYNTWNLSKETDHITSNSIPDLSALTRVKLEPGTAYRFRLRAINTVGIGDPGEPISFKTCLPGFPGAPSSIKISKSTEGAHLVWQPPPADASEKLEFTVYLAIKSPNRPEADVPPGQLVFVRVYSGANSQCLVANSTLTSAHVDYSAKPAIIFRIAARNSKGYGPATQVRWLQESSESRLAGLQSKVSPVKAVKRK